MEIFPIYPDFTWSPLMWACQEGGEPIVDKLLAANVNVNLTSRFGWSALALAWRMRNEVIVDKLLSVGAKQPKNGVGAIDPANTFDIPRLEFIVFSHYIREGLDQSELAPIHRNIIAENSSPCCLCGKMSTMDGGYHLVNPDGTHYPLDACSRGICIGRE